MTILEISKILTVFLDDYSNFEKVAEATVLDVSNKNKIGIDYSNFLELKEIKELLKSLNYDVDEIEQAFYDKQLDYINFEFWM